MSRGAAPIAPARAPRSWEDFRFAASPPRRNSSLFVVLAIAAGLIAAVPGYAAIAAPTPSTPSDTSTTNQSPVFGWNAVSGASYYIFQLASDSGFNSINYSFNTKNTRATITNALADNTYWWRVRAVNASSVASPWSNPMQFTKTWSDVPVLDSPADGDTVSFPTPLVLDWDPTPYAQRYHLILAQRLRRSPRW